MKEKVKKWLQWYLQSSTLVGAPVMLILVCVGFQKFFFTGTCYTVGWKCEYAMYADEDEKPSDKSMIAVPRKLMEQLRKDKIIDWWDDKS